MSLLLLYSGKAYTALRSVATSTGHGVVQARGAVNALLSGVATSVGASAASSSSLLAGLIAGTFSSHGTSAFQGVGYLAQLLRGMGTSIGRSRANGWSIIPPQKKGASVRSRQPSIIVCTPSADINIIDRGRQVVFLINNKQAG